MSARGEKPIFKKTVLKNGLTVVTERRRGFRSLSIGIWVNIGTRHEVGREAGISHFLEHMLFKGTATRSALDIAREVDQVGGDFNAFTTRECTCFHLLLLDRDADLGMDILSDVILNSDFNAMELERERKVILQEIAMVEESPEELVHDVFFELIYGDHGLGKPILGTEHSIRRLKRAEVLKFFKKHYRPDQMILSVSGDLSHGEIMKRLKKLSRHDWPGRPAPKAVSSAAKARKLEAKSPAERVLRELKLRPPKVKSGCWWVTRPTEQVHLVWGVAGPPYSSKDRFASFLLNIYLGGGMSSSLFQEIREKNGLAYTVYSTLSPFVDSGVFSIYVATGPKQVTLCLKLIEECVSKLKRELLTELELKTIQDNLKGSILLASDDVESRMTSIAKNELFLGGFYSPVDVCRMIDEVTVHDIRRMARKLLASDQRSIVAVGPKPTREVLNALKPQFPKKYGR